ncbi:MULTISPECIES: lipoprotein-34 precursor (NlpB) [unclassified Acinetobacter]|uniref:lipoprotein-34 precursor (NlpB) n=1 Tax=unclassified Acinetobacter TaxID=196816 RepID=UPI00190AB189|nr:MULTISPECIES: lipoprotein-34 precursor (NlpB) [unclassified Acinetobacter]MBK0065002.1 lipoprotein-34 precursor (NlpB) [Acinetobacter sp. S55]MBK0065338.1 lipoprotein-34 precursor (NlpB) [Acinetobacter sp. S54]
MMQLRLGLTFAIAAMGLVGCSSFNNHSLDYKNTTTLAPLQFPTDATVRPFTPLYPAPTVDELAIEHAPKLENKQGTRFALPRPDSAKLDTDTATRANSTVAMGRPQLVVDGNKNPLLQINGPTSDIWQYTVATLSSLNYKVLNENKAGYEATIKVGEQSYVLKLTGVGNTHNLALFNPDNSFADPAKATELLNQIYQNWPA